MMEVLWESGCVQRAATNTTSGCAERERERKELESLVPIAALLKKDSHKASQKMGERPEALSFL